MPTLQEMGKSRLYELVEQYLGPQPSEIGWPVSQLDKVAEVLSAIAGRVERPTRSWQRQSWGGKHLYNLLKGYEGYTMSDDLMEAIDDALAGRMPQKQTTVRSPFAIPQGTLILAEPRTCDGPFCDVVFVPTAWNQKYHSTQCKRDARRLRDDNKRKNS